MIQRIQTVFYTLAILALALPMANMEIFSFANEDMTLSVTLFGTASDELIENGRQFPIPQLPLFLGNLLVILLLLITIFSYKNLKKQAKLGRFTMIIYLLVMAGLCVMGYFLSQWLIAFRMSLMPGIGFYFMLAAIVFIWLGNRGVKSDRKLIASLDRLR